jgi:hypothetical protein
MDASSINMGCPCDMQCDAMQKDLRAQSLLPAGEELPEALDDEPVELDEESLFLAVLPLELELDESLSALASFLYDSER